MLKSDVQDYLEGKLTNKRYLNKTITMLEDKIKTYKGRGKENNNDSLSSGERNGKSPNLGGVPPEGCRTAFRNSHQTESSGKLNHSR